MTKAIEELERAVKECSEERKDVGYAKDNEGNELIEYPMQVFGEMVLLENTTKTSDPTQLQKFGGLELHTESEEHGQLGGWRVVAVGDLVIRVKKGDLVGNPIGNSVTPVQHPLIAHKQNIVNAHGVSVLASKKDLDYVYSLVNQQLIGLKYLEGKTQ